MKRIVMHWTAGTGKASATDKKHYHEVVEASGNRVSGDLLPEANLDTSDGKYAAHTRALNTGSVGLSMCGMKGAIERPFKAGQYPLTEVQLKEFTKMVAEYCDTYKIPVTKYTVLTHAEVEPTLKVWQRGKWDIMWLPGMVEPEDPVYVGNKIRRMVRVELRKMRRKHWFWRLLGL